MNQNIVDLGDQLLDDLGMLNTVWSALNIAAGGLQSALEGSLGSVGANAAAAEFSNIVDTEAAKGALGRLRRRLTNTDLRLAAITYWIKLRWEECEEGRCRIFWKRLEWKTKKTNSWCQCRTFPQHWVWKTPGATERGMSTRQFLTGLGACIQDLLNGNCYSSDMDI